MTAYKTLSSFIESPTVAQSDYIVGYSLPIFDGERRWKWTNVVNQLTADMLGPMSDGQLLIGNSTTNAYNINTLTEAKGINIVNGGGTITISVDPEDALNPMTDGQLPIGNTATGTYTKNTLTAGNGISVTNGNGTISIATAPRAPFVPVLIPDPANPAGPIIFEVTNEMHGQMIVIDSFFPVNVILPMGAQPGLDVSFIRAQNLGTVRFVPQGLSDIRSTPDNTFTQLAFVNSVAGAYYSGNNVWYIFGDLLP